MRKVELFLFASLFIYLLLPLSCLILSYENKLRPHSLALSLILVGRRPQTLVHTVRMRGCELVSPKTLPPVPPTERWSSRVKPAPALVLPIKRKRIPQANEAENKSTGI